MNISISRKAILEIKASKEWYDKQESGLGSIFLSDFEDAVSRIQQMPKGFPLVRIRIRKCLFSKFPFAVLYDSESKNEKITILVVYHQFRNPKTYLK